MTSHIDKMVAAHWNKPLGNVVGDYGRMYAAVEALPEFIQELILNNATEPPTKEEGDLLAEWEALNAKIDALPRAEEIREGDWVTLPAGKGVLNVFQAHMNLCAEHDEYRVLRRAPRTWKIGDLVDNTRDLPDGAVVLEESGDVAVYATASNAFSITGHKVIASLDMLIDPRIIWLPENGDES